MVMPRRRDGEEVRPIAWLRVTIHLRQALSMIIAVGGEPRSGARNPGLIILACL